MTNQIEVLAIGDPHYQISSLHHVAIFEKQLFQHLTAHRYDRIVMMGDLLHDHARLHSDCLSIACEFLKQLTLYCEHVYALVGNHDYTSNTNFLSNKHWMNCIKGFPKLTIVDTVVVETVHNIKIVYVPYCPDGRLIEALNTRKGEWEDAKCIFGHQLLDGCKMGSITAENVESWSSEYPTMISGHIHTKQRIGDNLIYTGSCMMHAFGESNDKSMTEIKLFDTGEKIISEVYLNTMKKVVRYMNVDEFKNLNLKGLDKVTEYKFSVNGSEAEFKLVKKGKVYKELLNTKHKIVFKPTRLQITDQKRLLSQISNGEGNLQLSFCQILMELVNKENNEDLKTIATKYATSY